MPSRWGKRGVPEGQGPWGAGWGSFPGLQGRAPRPGAGASFPSSWCPHPGTLGGCGAVRWDQQGPGPISPDLINRPFISVLKKSTVFCLLNYHSLSKPEQGFLPAPFSEQQGEEKAAFACSPKPEVQV